MELFKERQVLTVSRLTTLVRETLEDNFALVWVEGEISNLATPSSGHIYFTLKDPHATIRCVMFKGSAKALRFRPADGLKILLRARMSVYDQRGEYQLIAEYAEPMGLGALQLAFEQTRDRLAKEGLFDSSHKKPVPKLPVTVGIVTSSTGAAIHDILNVIGRRYAELQILIAPTRVQGEGAGNEIAAAIADLNRVPGVDVIICGRGGGSLEDLWAFNEEVVARAIFASKIPVISAVGHEVDVTIADLVADLRAATPSAAAELVVNSKSQMTAECEALERRLHQAVNRIINDAASRLEIMKLSLKDPEILIERFWQRLDDLSAALESELLDRIDDYRKRVESAMTRIQLSSPWRKGAEYGAHLDKLVTRLDSLIQHKLESCGSQLSSKTATLQALSPLATMSRGFAAVTEPDGRIVKGASALTRGVKLRLRFTDGEAACEVSSVKLNRT